MLGDTVGADDVEAQVRVPGPQWDQDLEGLGPYGGLKTVPPKFRSPGTSECDLI